MSVSPAAAVYAAGMTTRFFSLSHVRLLLVCELLTVLFFSLPGHSSSWRVAGSNNLFHAATTEANSFTSATAWHNLPRNHARESPPLPEWCSSTPLPQRQTPSRMRWPRLPYLRQ